MKETMRIYLTLRFLSLFGLSLSSATYVIFLQSRGLNLFEANLMNVACWLTLCLFQIPTGLLADVFGRKLSFLISCLLLSVDGIIYGSSYTMAGFILSEILAALGLTFASGAFEAWVVDRLKEQGYTGTQKMITTRSQIAAQAGSILGGVTGGFLGGINLSLPWYTMSGVFMLVGVYALLAMKENFTTNPDRAKDRLLQWRPTFPSSLRFLRQSKTLHFVLAIDVVMACAMQPLNMFWQPYFKQVFGETELLGFLKAGIALSIMAGAFLVMRWGGVQSPPQLLIRILLLLGVVVVLTSLLPPGILVLAPFLLHEVLRGMYEPVKTAYQQEQLPDAERATIASIISMVVGLAGAVGLFISGFIAEYVSISTSWIVSGIGFILIAGYHARKEKK